jgi:hypothetical protein
MRNIGASMPRRSTFSVSVFLQSGQFESCAYIEPESRQFGISVRWYPWPNIFPIILCEKSESGTPGPAYIHQTDEIGAISRLQASQRRLQAGR